MLCSPSALFFKVLAFAVCFTAAHCTAVINVHTINEEPIFGGEPVEIVCAVRNPVQSDARPKFVWLSDEEPIGEHDNNYVISSDHHGLQSRLKIVRSTLQNNESYTCLAKVVANQ